MDTFEFRVTTTGNHPIPAKGNFIRYCHVSTGQAAPRIRVRTNNGDSLVMDPGDKARLPRVFDRIEVENEEGSVTVEGLLVIGEGDFDSAAVTGEVAITQASTITNVAEKAVGAAAVKVSDASAGRRSLRFHYPAAGASIIWLGGAGITVAAGCVRLLPGETWVESDGAAGEWWAIAEAAAQTLRVQEVS